MANLFWSQGGVPLLVFLFAALGLGALSQGWGFFFAIMLVFEFGIVTLWLRHRREQRTDHLLMASSWIPQTDIPKEIEEGPGPTRDDWVKANPHLIKTTITRVEAQALADEKGWPVSHWDRFIID